MASTASVSLGSMPKVPLAAKVRRLQTYPEYLQEKHSQLHMSIPASWSRGPATHLNTQDLHDTSSRNHKLSTRPCGV
jgi:hypothetical protein